MFNDPYWLRDVANRAMRRARKLVGRPDNSPWVLRPPARPRGGSGAYVDFVFGLDFVGNNAALTSIFRDAMFPYGVSLLVANKHNVARLTREIGAGVIKPHVYLDLCSAVHAEFGDLLGAAAGAGVHTIGEPAKLDQWTYKARAQRKLEEAGLPVPPTVLVHAGEPTRELTADERHLVGERCVIKPSWGVAGKGVLANVKPTAANIDAARKFNPADDYLVQRMIKWETLGDGRTGYLRAYHVLGHRTLLWWEPATQAYDLLTWDDVREHDLMPAIDLVDRLAELTGLEYFSSEIAITNGVGQPRFVLIDYCNDQCDMVPTSEELHGLPVEWVRWACARFAEFVWRKKHGLPAGEGQSLWFATPGGDRTGSGGKSSPSTKARIVTAA